MASDDRDTLLTTEQAAALLQISVRTIRSRAPRIKVGRAVRYSRWRLLAWAESQTVDPTKEGAV